MNGNESTETYSHFNVTTIDDNRQLELQSNNVTDMVSFKCAIYCVTTSNPLDTFYFCHVIIYLNSYGFKFKKETTA